MKRWSFRQVFAILLGVFVALGMSLSVVQATNMAAKMINAADMAASAHDDCGGCAGSGDDSANAMTCVSVCSPSTFAVLPHLVTMTVAETRTDFVASEGSPFFSRTPPPDPYPPKSGDLG